MVDVVAQAWTIAMAMSQDGRQKQEADSEGVHVDGWVFISGSSSVLALRVFL